MLLCREGVQTKESKFHQIRTQPTASDSSTATKSIEIIKTYQRYLKVHDSSTSHQRWHL